MSNFNWPDYWSENHREIVGGFDIVFSTRPDWDSNRHAFIARVEATLDGHTLGYSYLGGCQYDTAQQFRETPGYYDDMVKEAIADAKDTCRRLIDQMLRLVDRMENIDND